MNTSPEQLENEVGFRLEGKHGHFWQGIGWRPTREGIEKSLQWTKEFIAKNEMKDMWTEFRILKVTTTKEVIE